MHWSCFRDLGGIGYWLTSPEVAYQSISAIILGWSVAYAWIELVISGYGRIGRVAGISLCLAGAIVYSLIHTVFSSVLR